MSWVERNFIYLFFFFFFPAVPKHWPWRNEILPYFGEFRETETVSWILHSRLSTGTHEMFTCLPDIPSSGSKSTVMKSQCITAATWSLVPETVFLLLTELYRAPAHHGKGPSEKPKDIHSYGPMECHCIHFLMTISAFLSNCLIETAVMYEEWKENISYRGYHHLVTASELCC